MSYGNKYKAQNMMGHKGFPG